MNNLINPISVTDDYQFYANTTNGPEYIENVCINCQNRIMNANFNLKVTK